LSETIRRAFVELSSHLREQHLSLRDFLLELGDNARGLSHDARGLSLDQGTLTMPLTPLFIEDAGESLSPDVK